MAAEVGTGADGVWKLRARNLFDRLDAVLATSGLGARQGLRMAGLLGMLRGTLSGRWPDSRDVHSLYGTRALASRRIALEIAGHESRNRHVLRRVIGRSMDPYAPLIRWSDSTDLRRFRPPQIFVTAHLGALHLMSPAFNRLGIRRTVLRWGDVHQPAMMERNSPLAGGLAARTRALMEALSELEGGGFVSTTLDGGNGASEPGRLLGRSFEVGKGTFHLARRSGANVIPVAALWREGGVTCVAGEPVRSAQEAADWTTSLLERNPGQISLGLLRRLLFGPPAIHSA